MKFPAPRRFCAIWLLACAGLAQAAIRIQGVVVDVNSLPVPGAVLSLRGPNYLQARAVSDAAGHFQTGPLPPGEYQIHIDKPGFFAADAPLSLTAATGAQRYVLHAAEELKQQVQVTASVNPIDVATTTPTRQIDQQEIRDVPQASSHDLRQSLPLVPGVVTDNLGQPHLGGARSDQTGMELDNFEIGSPLNGSLESRLTVDAVRTINSEEAPDAAQPNAAAGVLALQTQMGGDQFRYQVVNFLPVPAWEQGPHLGNWYPRLTWSGPLRRGRAWFSEAVSLQHTLSIVPSLPSGQNLGSQWLADSLTRLQLNFSPRNSLIGDVLWNGTDLGHSGLDALNPIPTTSTVKGQRTFVSLLDEVNWAGGLWQAGVGWERESLRSAPLGGQLYVEAPQGDSGNYFQTLDTQAARLQALASGWLPLKTPFGEHDLGFGFNYDRIEAAQQAARNPFEIATASGTPIEMASFQGSGTWRLNPHQAGVYVEDSWQMGRDWRLQPALRVDRETLTAGALVQPRLSGSFLPFGDDRGKLYASTGLFVEPVSLALYGEGLDQTRLDRFYNSAGQETSQSTEQFLAPVRALPPPRFLISTAGWQQNLGNGTFAGLALIARNQRDGWAWTPEGSGFVLDDLRRDRYRAAELTLQRVFHARTEIYADYTRSLDRTNQALDYTLLSPVYSPQAAGPLPWDAPNRFLAWGWTQTSFQQLLLSYSLEYHTGFPYNIVDAEQQLLGAPGAQRFPSYLSLDLGFERPVTFRDYVWALRLTVANLSDHNNPTVVIANTGSPNYGMFEGSEGRVFTLRLRLVGKVPH